MTAANCDGQICAAETPVSGLLPGGISKRTWAWLYFSAFAWYYLIWVLVNYVEAPDSLAYLQMGRGVFESFTFGYLGDDGQYYANAFRMPVVPSVLGALYVLCRDQHIAYGFYTLLQACLAPVLPCVAFYFGSRIGRAVGFAAYVFLLFHANVVMSTLYVLSDIPFAATTGVTFVLLYRLLESQSPRQGLLTGLVAGAACMVRPIMKLYVLVPAVMLLFSRSPMGKRLRILALFLVGFVLVVSPWLVRNFARYHRVVFETNQGLNLLWSNSDLVQVSDTDSSETRALKKFLRDHRSEPMDFVLFAGKDYWLRHDLAVSDRLQEIAVEAYKRNPAAVARTWFGNFGKMIAYQTHYEDVHSAMVSKSWYHALRRHVPLAPDSFDRKVYHLMLEVKRAVRICYTYLAWIGLALLCITRFRLAAFMAVHILYFTGLTAFVAGYDRYRLNIEVFFAVLIVYPLVLVMQASVNKLAGRRGDRPYVEENTGLTGNSADQ
jgi:hypothetical protein